MNDVCGPLPGIGDWNPVGEDRDEWLVMFVEHFAADLAGAGSWARPSPGISPWPMDVQVGVPFLGTGNWNPVGEAHDNWCCPRRFLRLILWELEVGPAFLQEILPIWWIYQGGKV
jgi:hypothetical protein